MNSDMSFIKFLLIFNIHLLLHIGAMASWLVCSTPKRGPGRGHCVVFLGKTLYSHGASLHPGVQMGTGVMLGVTLRWTSLPSRGELKILLVA